MLELGLPKVDGYEVAKRVRATPGMSGVRIIAVTADGLDSDRERTAKAGIDLHLLKPVSIESLLSAVTATEYGDDVVMQRW